MTDTSTGGVLQSIPPLPMDDVALDGVLQTLISSITALDGTMVRPMWQVAIPKEEDANVDWCAFGVTSIDADASPYYWFDNSILTGIYWRHETLTVLAHFYGPNSMGFASMLRDGLAVPQNTEALNQYEMRFIESGPLRNVPEFFNQQWFRRQDVLLTFRRKVKRTYTVQYLQVAAVRVLDDTVVDDTFAVPAGTKLAP